MDFAIKIFQIVFYSFGIAFMGTFIFLGIWGFVIFNKMRKGLAVQNYILEKIYKVISNKFISSESSSINMNEFLQDDVFSDPNKSDKIIKFDEV